VSARGPLGRERARIKIGQTRTSVTEVFANVAGIRLFIEQKLA